MNDQVVESGRLRQSVADYTPWGSFSIRLASGTLLQQIRSFQCQSYSVRQPSGLLSNPREVESVAE